MKELGLVVFSFMSGIVVVGFVFRRPRIDRRKAYSRPQVIYEGRLRR